jgi:hypothetical protein
MEMKLGSTVYLATLTRCLPAQFATFAAVWFASVVGGIMCTNMERRAGLCLQAEGDQFQHASYFNIYQGNYPPTFDFVGKLSPDL